MTKYLIKSTIIEFNIPHELLRMKNVYEMSVCDQYR